MTSAGSEAIDLAASVGLVLDDWQQDTITDALGERANGRWSALEVGVIVPRQNGKGAILEARELAGLFLFGEALILHSAHEFKTAREAFLRVRAYVDNYDHLRRRVKRVRTSHGEEGIELTNGHRLNFVARSTGSGRGFSGDCNILDESYNLSEDALSALFPTMSARPNPQVWYTSSAPLVGSVMLRKLCRRGRKGQAGLAYFEWCAEHGVDPEDRRWWAFANPGLGIRLTEEFTAAELGALGLDGFMRERLGVWHEHESEHVIGTELWMSRSDGDSNMGEPVAFAVDTTPARSHTSIAAAGLRSDGRVHVEVVDHREGTRWVVDRLRELADVWHPCALAIDPASGAGAFLKALDREGFKTEPGEGETRLHILGAREVAQAFGAFVDLVRNDGMRHRAQAPLNAAVDGAGARPLADALTWSRRTSAVDISPLVAATNAAHSYATFGAVEAPEAVAPMAAWL